MAAVGEESTAVDATADGKESVRVDEGKSLAAMTRRA